jgi:hypothetical protein
VVFWQLSCGFEQVFAEPARAEGKARTIRTKARRDKDIWRAKDWNAINSLAYGKVQRLLGIVIIYISHKTPTPRIWKSTWPVTGSVLPSLAHSNPDNHSKAEGETTVSTELATPSSFIGGRGK